jgi:predicted ATP-grasp superfamily ATP-dependent carboligase
VISPEKKNLTSIQEAMTASLSKNEIERIRCLTLVDFLTFLDEEEARAAATEQTVKGLQGEG